MKNFVVLFSLLFAMLAFSSCERNEEILEAANPAATLTQRSIKKCAPPTITVSPCDKSFSFTATRGGMPDSFNFPYGIYDSSGNLVDSGAISNGNNTAPVLNYCQSYTLKFQDWCVGWVTITMTSDGCNNTFLC